MRLLTIGDIPVPIIAYSYKISKNTLPFGTNIEFDDVNVLLYYMLSSNLKTLRTILTPKMFLSSQFSFIW